jgi:hypothetical protein
MCQRNSFRIRTLGGTVDFVARQLANFLINCTTVPEILNIGYKMITYMGNGGFFHHTNSPILQPSFDLSATMISLSQIFRWLVELERLASQKPHAEPNEQEAIPTATFPASGVPSYATPLTSQGRLSVLPILSPG